MYFDPSASLVRRSAEDGVLLTVQPPRYVRQQQSRREGQGTPGKGDWNPGLLGQSALISAQRVRSDSRTVIGRATGRHTMTPRKGPQRTAKINIGLLASRDPNAISSQLALSVSYSCSPHPPQTPTRSILVSQIDPGDQSEKLRDRLKVQVVDQYREN